MTRTLRWCAALTLVAGWAAAAPDPATSLQEPADGRAAQLREPPADVYADPGARELIERAREQRKARAEGLTSFEATFREPTEIQRRGWARIGAGQHALLLAPTGSGKTLAAFLSAIDRLGREPVDADPGVRVVYISPLKALAYDVDGDVLYGVESVVGDDLLITLHPTTLTKTGTIGTLTGHDDVVALAFDPQPAGDRLFGIHVDDTIFSTPCAAIPVTPPCASEPAPC